MDTLREVIVPYALLQIVCLDVPLHCCPGICLPHPPPTHKNNELTAACPPACTSCTAVAISLLYASPTSAISRAMPLAVSSSSSKLSRSSAAETDPCSAQKRTCVGGRLEVWGSKKRGHTS